MVDRRTPFLRHSAPKVTQWFVLTVADEKPTGTNWLLIGVVVAAVAAIVIAVLILRKRRGPKEEEDVKLP